MNPDTYTVKEMIDEFRRDVSQRFDKVDIAQAHTNGDVGRLKLRSAFLTGGLSVIAILVIPLIVYIWNQTQSSQLRLQSLTNQQQYYENNQSK